MVSVRTEHVKCKGKGIFVTVHAMTANRGSRGRTPFIFNFSTRWKRV